MHKLVCDDFGRFSAKLRDILDIHAPFHINRNLQSLLRSFNVRYFGCWLDCTLRENVRFLDCFLLRVDVFKRTERVVIVIVAENERICTVVYAAVVYHKTVVLLVQLVLKNVQLIVRAVL